MSNPTSPAPRLRRLAAIAALCLLVVIGAVAVAPADSPDDRCADVTRADAISNGGGDPRVVDVANGDEGTEGDDVIFGTDGDDDIDAKGGNDVVCGFAGDDVIDGDAGNDEIYGGE